MPEYSPQRYTKREQVSPQETFRVTTPNLAVTAQPIDAFAQPAADPTLRSLISLTESIQKGIGAYAQYKEVTNREEESKGAILAAAGKPLPSKPSDALIRGYEQMTGEAKVYEFHQKAQEYLMQNHTADPETFRQGLNSILQSYLDGPSDSFIKGFVPKAKNVESQILSQFIEKKQQEVRQNVLANVATIVRQRVEVEGTRDPVQLRNLLTDMQNRAKEFGVTRTEVTKEFFELMDGMASLSGDPNLLMFALEKDKDGQTPADIIGLGKVRDSIQRAISAREEMQNIRRRAVEEAEKQRNDLTTLDLLDALSKVDRTDPQSVLKIKQKIQSNKNNLDPSTYRTLLHDVQSMFDPTGQRLAISNEGMLHQAYTLASQGKLTNPFVFAPYLSHADLEEIIKKQAETSVSLQNAETREALADEQRYESLLLKRVAVVNKLDPSGFLNSTEAEKARHAGYLWWKGVKKLKEDTGKTKLSDDELFDLSTSIVEKVTGKKTTNATEDYEKSIGQSGAPPKPGESSSPTIPSIKRLENLKNKQEKRSEIIGGEQVKLASAKLTQFEPFIEEASSREKIDPIWIKAMIMAESGGNPKATSKVGARGLMQLMPSTGAEVGVTNLENPRENIAGGSKYFRKLLSEFKNPILALAAYNAGPERVRRYGGIPPFEETQQYIRNVIQYYALLKMQGGEGVG